MKVDIYKTKNNSVIEANHKLNSLSIKTVDGRQMFGSYVRFQTDGKVIEAYMKDGTHITEEIKKVEHISL